MNSIKKLFSKTSSSNNPPTNGSPSPGLNPVSKNSGTYSNILDKPLASLQLSDLLVKLPSLSSPSTPSVHATLFLHKLKLCSLPFEYYSSSSELTHTRIRNAKTMELTDILNHLTQHSTPSDTVLPSLFHFFASNLFRSFPSNSFTASYGERDFGPEANSDAEGEAGREDPAWTHLQIVYECLLRFLVCTDVEMKYLRKYVNGTFVRRIVNLFDSPDHREREFLKTLLHRIYVKFLSMRAFIRKCMNDIFFIFIYETERYNGIAELLEICGSLIAGFALPLHEEHTTFLVRVLLPLHKSRSLSQFHPQLQYCVTQFLLKDPSLSSTVIRGLLKFWPITNSAKTILFINELEEVIELTPNDHLENVMIPLFTHIKTVLLSFHFQVSERILFLWHNELIANFINQHKNILLPLLYDALHKNKTHWNAIVNTLSINIIKLFEEYDNELVIHCSSSLESLLAERNEKISKRKKNWQELLKALDNNQNNLLNNSQMNENKDIPQSILSDSGIPSPPEDEPEGEPRPGLGTGTGTGNGHGPEHSNDSFSYQQPSIDPSHLPMALDNSITDNYSNPLDEIQLLDTEKVSSSSPIPITPLSAVQLDFIPPPPPPEEDDS